MTNDLALLAQVLLSGFSVGCAVFCMQHGFWWAPIIVGFAAASCLNTLLQIAAARAEVKP